MPGLLRGVARTAVIAGTATAVSGNVQRRQADKYAQRDAEIYAKQEAAYQQTQAATPAAQSDKFDKLKELGELKAQGILSEAEFESEKAKILNG